MAELPGIHTAQRMRIFVILLRVQRNLQPSEIAKKTVEGYPVGFMQLGAELCGEVLQHQALSTYHTRTIIFVDSQFQRTDPRDGMMEQHGENLLMKRIAED
jgi:hypothetical protein